MKDETIIAITLMVITGGLQTVAWMTGHNGVVFAATSAILVGVGKHYYDKMKYSSQ